MDENEIYRRKYCELCEREVFEKYLGTAKVLDGGFTRIENWEKSGFGSMSITFWHIPELEKGRSDFRLCPECAKKINTALDQAIEKIKCDAKMLKEGR